MPLKICQSSASPRVQSRYLASGRSVKLSRHFSSGCLFDILNENPYILVALSSKALLEVALRDEVIVVPISRSGCLSFTFQNVQEPPLRWPLGSPMNIQKSGLHQRRPGPIYQRYLAVACSI